MIFLSAIGLGLAGSLHCVGMCGPIALAVPVGRGDAASKAIAYLLYRFGHITGYATLGFMAAFGLGTAPALIAPAVAGHPFGTSFRTRFRRITPLLATAVAVLFILRGLGLGIPYVSPEPGFVINATESCP